MHVARKRFGQNFLVDPRVIRRIIEAIAPASADRIVEIGPGLGALTKPLLDAVGHLDVLEIDRDIVASLREQYPPERLSVHEGDALDFEFASLGNDLRVVGNLPYNISTPLLFRVGDAAAHVRDCHFMLQKEVVDRMVSPPGTREYGRLSVMLQYRFDLEKLFEVGSGAFRPAPRVTSAIVRMAPKSGEGDARALDEAVFGRLVTQAFSFRRKTLRNALQGWLDEAALEAVGLDPGLRPETLSVGDFVAAANAAVSRRGAE